MGMNKLFRFGPLALTNVLTTNILNPATTTGGINSGTSPLFIKIKHIRIVNKTSVAATASLWLGATGANAAGTEIINGKSVPANDYIDLYDELRLDSTDFLVGGSNTSSALTIYGEGEIGVAG